MSEWISVKARLPDVEVPVLIAYKSYLSGHIHADETACVIASGTWCWWDEDVADEPVVVEITHWMPLPEPPKEGET